MICPCEEILCHHKMRPSNDVCKGNSITENAHDIVLTRKGRCRVLGREPVVHGLSARGRRRAGKKSRRKHAEARSPYLSLDYKNVVGFSFYTLWFF